MIVTGKEEFTMGKGPAAVGVGAAPDRGETP